MRDTLYWENYYKSALITDNPSPFAKWVLRNQLRENMDLIELGCGNGRDSLFFAKNGVRVLAVDQCAEEIELLARNKQHPNIEFSTADFTRLNLEKTFDAVYSRFTLHSIDEAGEDRTIAWIKEHIKPGGKLLIEARGHKNEIYRLGEPVEGQPHAFIYENHYRRFVELDTLNKKLKLAGFTIMLSLEEKGFAPFKDTDYTFIRVIASK